VDLAAVNGGRDSDCGVAHGARLLAFTEAVMANDRERMASERRVLHEVLGDEAFVDVVATIAAFNVVDRIADATGIPLDPLMQAMSVDVRAELGLSRFASSANTPE
jgi:alkylhydroperoxidase family enzyme